MRRIIKILGCLTAGALVALAVLPWWLGPVLKGVAGRYGATFARYERIGYARFAVYGVVVEQPTVRVTVERAEYATPAVWLARRLSGKPSRLVATGWRVEVKPRATATVTTVGPARPSGAMPLHGILRKVATGLDRWLPEAEIGAGKVAWPGGGLELAAATWEHRVLAARGFHLGGLTADVRVLAAADGALELEAKSDAQAWRAAFKNAGDQITGEVRVLDQLATVKARFAPTGWMPAEAEVRADHWSVPGTRVKLGQFYSAVRGDARIDWRDGKFEASADAVGDAIPDRKAPPLTTKLRGRGDAGSFTIDSLAIEIPGVSAGLSAPAVVDRRGRMVGDATKFSLAVDLEKQPWFAAKGRVTGEVQLKPRDGATPVVEAVLTAQDVALPDWAIARFGATAQLDWPRLTVKQAEFGFAEGGQLEVHGEWDFDAKEIRDAVAEGTVRPSLIARWLPKAVGFESIAIAAKASGPVAALVHEGKAHVTALTVPNLRPLAADVTWLGKGAGLTIKEASVQAGGSQLALAGTLDAAGAQLTALKLSKGEAVRLVLAHPAPVRWSAKIEVGPLEFAGDDASLTIAATTGASGRLNLTARNFSSVWLADFVTLPGPEWRIASLTAEGEWDRGPLAFKTEGELAVALGTDRSAAVAFKAHGAKDGVEVESLRVAEGAAAIVTAAGRLPFVFFPGAAPFAQILPDAPLAFHATTTSNPAFWKKLAETTGLTFEEPEATLELSGTWGRPQGEIRAKAARLAADGKIIHSPVSSVEALELHVVADRAGLTVDPFTAKIEGQAVRASGKLAFTPEQWMELKKDPVAFVRQRGSLHLEIPDAEVAALARHFPDLLAQAGRLEVDATLAPGGEMKGTLRVRDAATRPLGGLGVLQEVQGELQLAGNTIVVRSLTARAGGQPVTVSGQVELPLKAAPKYDLALKGENLPLVRQTGLLVRADVDLKFITASSNVPAITGIVRLRDSMFLSDLRAFIPHGGGGGPTRRPPYFAIERPPFDTWRLDVSVQGEQFIRLRSTLFTGVASARFKIGGTLGDPRMTGEAVVDSGTVSLPFAAFKIEEGTVRLTVAEPNALHLAVTGTSRRYGYDLRMEVTGTAEAPVIIFYSSPSLEAKQVLLMVMTGELPHDEITYGNAQRAARLGTYLGQSLITTLGGDATESDRLSISTGEKVSSLGRETYDVEYRLSDRFTLVGEYDEYDAYNAGVKWSVRPPDSAPAKKAEPTAGREKEKEVPLEPKR